MNCLRSFFITFFFKTHFYTVCIQFFEKKSHVLIPISCELMANVLVPNLKRAILCLDILIVTIFLVFNRVSKRDHVTFWFLHSWNKTKPVWSGVNLTIETTETWEWLPPEAANTKQLIKYTVESLYNGPLYYGQSAVTDKTKIPDLFPSLTLLLKLLFYGHF